MDSSILTEEEIDGADYGILSDRTLELLREAADTGCILCELDDLGEED